VRIALGHTVVLCLLAQLGQAETVNTFVFETTFDTSAIGGAPDVPLRVVYRFRSDLAPGTGPFADLPPTVAGYGPIEVDVQLGPDTVHGAGIGTGITVFNDAGSTHDEDSYDVRGDSRNFGVQRLLGYQVELFRFLLVDNDHTMFGSAALPVSTAFATQADVAYVDAQLLDDQGHSITLTSSGRPYTLTRVLPTCSSTVTTLVELRAEVTALHTSSFSKQVLRQILNAVAAALEAGQTTGARRRMGDFVAAVIQRANRAPGVPGRIPPDEASRLICSASNVILNLGGQ